MFSSIDDVVQQFAGQKYICSRAIATVVYLASKMGKPILVEGRLKLYQWKDKEGHDRQKIGVVVESFQFVGSGGTAKQTSAPWPRTTATPSTADDAAPPDYEIPF